MYYYVLQPIALHLKNVDKSAYCDTQTHSLCDTGECISREMVCDGIIDCFDNSDEKHCTEWEKQNINAVMVAVYQQAGYVMESEIVRMVGDENNCTKSCIEGYDSCNDGKCIPSYLFCNGQKDCEENEDESKCGNANSCLPENGHFLCHDNSKCLEDNLVCDRKPHCDDKSDEGGKCDIACEDSKPPCTQGCFKTPSGPQCKCKAGFSLQNDNQLCQDINECELETQVCDHFCENNNGGYKCSCAQNYRLLEGTNDDNATCRITEPAMLLFSVGNQIIGKMMDNSEKWIVSDTTGKNPSSIAFDPKFENVYWIYNSEGIYMKSLKGREEPKVFLQQGLDNPENLAVDWLGRNIYITEYKKSQIIGVYLYYTTITSHKIIKVGLDGKGSKVLVNENIVWPNGLALDYPAKRIFWVDANLDKIESSNYEGRNRKGFPIKDASHAYSLAVWQDRIYWTDWEKGSKKEIHSCRKRDGMVWESEYKDEKREVRNIMIYHSSIFKSVHNPCDGNLRKKCSHICLLSPTNPDGYACACPRDMKLKSDNHICEVLGNFALVSVQSNVYRVPLKYYASPLTTPEKLVKLNTGNVVDMDYNPLKDEIYFADPNNESISKVSLKNGKTQKVIEKIRFPTSVAVDWLRDNLYWVNGAHNTIEVSRTSGTYRKKIAENIHSPTDIALDVTKGNLYISDSGVLPSINKCELNGSSCRVLANSDIPKVTSLHVDLTSEPRKIYWTNAERNRIESIDEYGENRIVEIIDLNNPVRINVNEDYIIWTEKHSNVIYFAPKYTHEMIRFSRLDISDVPIDSYFMALTSVYSKPSSLKEFCFSNQRKCHQFCFSKDLNMVCGCSQGLVLQSDGTTCSTPKCSSNEWTCKNGECIFSFTRCDGSADCSDESDEKNCTVTCSEDKFQCKDGSCIKNKDKCDGFRDCRDGSDEDNCTKTKINCKSNSWQCDSGECLPHEWRCDEKVQCNDGSDEKNCDKIVCTEDKKKCNNACKLGEYKCKDGTCLDEGKLCRNEVSCGSEVLNLTCSTFAPDTHTDCPLNFVPCDPLASDIKCIPFEGWCNKTLECPNREDEKFCECDEDKVKCSGEETCIFRKWICDNIEDCADGSDEKGCSPLVKHDPVEEFCTSGFKCTDGTCISNDKVCDGHNDCDTGIDESGDCDKCQHNNGGCQQICHNYPTKVKCSCKTGFKLSTDGISCEDVNECENEEICQHYCVNIKGSYYCTCAEGYTLKADETSCKADIKHPSLVIVRNKKVDFYDEDFQISHDSKFIPKHFSSKTKFIYDPVNKKLIGIDGQSGIIYSESSGKWLKEIASINDVKDVSFDYINMNIYIARPNIVYKRPSPKFESREMGSTIQVYNLESKLLGELFVVPDKTITSLELSLKFSLMFTCENDEAKGIIMERNLDGSIMSTLVDEKIIHCSSLVIDEFKDRLYWIDEALNRIESVDFLGGERRKFLSKQVHGPKSLSLLNHHLLWFNNDQNALVKCSITAPNNCTEFSFSEKSDTFILNTERVYDFSVPTPCRSSPCVHLCVPHLMDVHHCACAIGYRYENYNCTLAIDLETGGIQGNCAASPCKFGTCVDLPFGQVTCKNTKLRFVRPSFVLIEEESMSQPPTPPVPRSVKVYPNLQKQGSQIGVIFLIH
ncbi:Low-density lipoprotein receptor-related protein 2 [Armadillidium nasatum]|uniref:Low-density lipoprotein receptor-related protein 2 n=1 Tax=Armadillidium nasatum TaxID=96803 RepID=A0A5N5TA42_9CRUS|nr:Low-density lipoprotein receptor-related protein 2 [Armadillidium nasatum]